MTESQTEERVATRVVVVAEGGLVAETIEVALQAQGFSARSMPFPRGRAEVVETRRSVDGFSAQTGVVVAEVDAVEEWRDVLGLVEGVDIPWLLVTGSDSLGRWGGLLAAGCVGVVRMADGLDVLAETVRSVAAHGAGMDAVQHALALGAWHDLGVEQRDVVRRIAALSPREWEVLGLLGEGHTTASIAQASGVSEGTVRSQVRAIRQKLNVRSQLAAVAAYQTATEFGR